MILDELAAMPARVDALVAQLGDLRARPAAEEFCALEHLCHLRDLEVEGYGVRIERLLGESAPFLPDFDGARVARERDYLGADAAAAARAFAQARARNVARLRAASESDLAREGTLETVGMITLKRLAELMAEHDAGHLRELAVAAALDRFTRNRRLFREQLEALCRIPGVSAGDAAPVRKSAEAVARLLESNGVTEVRLLEVEGAHPAVYGTLHADDGAPSILIYGHHDVQPPGDLARWTTPPFEPVERDGRLYGRGTSDDKGGVLAHIAAAASYAGAPPCNLRFFIEGEEEIGSPHLGRFLEQYRELLRADAVVLADSPNYATGIPALISSLRGMCMVDVEVRCLERPLHSGRGGGAVPDAIAILCQLITAVIPAANIAPDDAALRRDLGLLDGVALLGTRDDTWHGTSVTVIGFDAPPVERSFNQIAASARARLSLRTVPPQRSDDAGRALVERLLALPMPHARVSAHVVKSAPWWCTDASGPVYDAARSALARGYGRETMVIGAGGTIGFVGTFAAAFPGTPLILMGVEDPPCNAHAENESLHLGDWERCARSSIFLYDAVAQALR